MGSGMLGLTIPYCTPVGTPNNGDAKTDRKSSLGLFSKNLRMAKALLKMSYPSLLAIAPRVEPDDRHARPERFSIPLASPSHKGNG
jgi:hypothetical protein